MRYGALSLLLLAGTILPIFGQPSDVPDVQALQSSASGSQREVGDGLGVRAGVGADITFAGAAFGAGINHLVLSDLEAGLLIYYGRVEETSNNGFNEYRETTEVTAFAILANYLYGYRPNTDVWYLVGGIGLAYLGVYWEERSDTDTTLGELLPGGGSRDTFEGGVGGTLFNVGAGYAFAGGFDLRLEVPVLLAFGDTGGASGVVPLFTLSAGYRFTR